MAPLTASSPSESAKSAAVRVPAAIGAAAAPRTPAAATNQRGLGDGGPLARLQAKEAVLVSELEAAANRKGLVP